MTFAVVLSACSKGARSNLTLGTEIGLGQGKVKITGAFETMKTPLKGNPPKQSGNKFIGIETSVLSLPEGSQLCSGGCVLKSPAWQYVAPAAYGKMELFGGVSNFEAVDGAVVYVGKVGDSLNVFFEVPESVSLKEVQLSYDPARVPASADKAN